MSIQAALLSKARKREIKPELIKSEEDLKMIKVRGKNEERQLAEIESDK